MTEGNRAQQEQDADKQKRLAALDRIRKHREQILAERDGKPLDFDVVEAIEEAREEQDERNVTLGSSRNG
jgi:hypothetical protein